MILNRKAEIDIKMSFGNLYVFVHRHGHPRFLRKHKNPTPSSLIRAQRMQLKLYDAMKGQSPDETTS